MSVLAAVEAAMASLGAKDWQSALACELAQIIDDRGRGPVGRVNAAIELRKLMTEVAGEATPQTDALDDLAKRRERRRAS